MLMVAGLAAGAAAPQTLPRDSGDWRVEYATSGGLQFRSHAVTVARTGDVTARDTRLGDRRLGAGVAGADRPAGAAAGERGSCAATRADARRDLHHARADHRRNGVPALPTPELSAALDKAWNKVVGQALLGSWRQAGWKLCKPVPQMNAADIDPPIDSLVFRPDGTFSVTWRGGGAHTLEIPHREIPDYDGRYAAVPAKGTMHLEFVSGIARPRDFSGNGTYAISNGQLTLKGIWLGTFQAARKPDICELTFVRP